MKPRIRILILPTAMLVLLVAAVAMLLEPNARDTNVLADESPSSDRTATPAKRSGTFSPYVDQDGNISLPTDYKRNWAHLGGWAVSRKPGEAIHEMHAVYTQPETIAAYNKSGEFPDGAVLVKEVHAAETDGLTTGHAAWSTNIRIWFVMIKDRKQRFKDNDHWGDGWGWALFEAKDPTKNVSVGYDTSCLGCHIPAEDSDWVYTFGYPELKKPKSN